MAAQRGLKGFYLGLAVVAVVGVGALWMARRSNAGGTRTIEPLALADGAAEGHVMGSDSAPVTVVEYADFECPACAQFAIFTMEDARRRLIRTGRVRWIFRDFPLEVHRNAPAAHVAAACAGDQGKFWEMHDQLYYNHGRWVREQNPEGVFRDFARALGLDLDRFDACVKSDAARQQVEALHQIGVQRGVGSTPTFEIGNQLVSGVMLIDSLETLVDRAAASAKR